MTSPAPIRAEDTIVAWWRRNDLLVVARRDRLLEGYLAARVELELLVDELSHPDDVGVAFVEAVVLFQVVAFLVDLGAPRRLRRELIDNDFRLLLVDQHDGYRSFGWRLLEHRQEIDWPPILVALADELSVRGVCG